MAKASKNNTKVVFDREKMLLSDNSKFTVQEAYKTLRTNVTFSLPGKGCKAIGIISPNRGEGKSSVAINLAISIAQINKRVIIVDCDMRLPTVASKLDIESYPGLSNYLTGATEEIPIRHLNQYGVDVIASGNIPPDTTSLIESDQMLMMIDKLRENYDYIIFDFPPITIVPDAVILTSHIDGYLVIVRQNISEFQKIKEALKQLQFTNAKLLGFIYNGKAAEKKYYKKRNYKYYSDNYYYKKARPYSQK